jgi:hypothetical protein
MMGLGPLLDLMGLFHAVLSGAGRIVINFIACRQMMPDPDFYKACLAEAYEELQLAAQQSNRKPQAKRATKRRTATNKKH